MLSDDVMIVFHQFGSLFVCEHHHLSFLSYVYIVDIPSADNLSFVYLLARRLFAHESLVCHIVIGISHCHSIGIRHASHPFHVMCKESVSHLHIPVVECYGPIFF